MRLFALVLLLVTACGPKNDVQPVGTDPPPSGDCIKTGCSGTVCTEAGNEMMTTCEWKPEYACYQSAACARQSSGACGWTETAELAVCLANPPAPQ